MLQHYGLLNLHYWGAYALHGELHALFPPVWLEPMKTGKEGPAWTRQKPSTVALPRICEHTKEKNLPIRLSSLETLPECLCHTSSHVLYTQGQERGGSWLYQGA